jgi:hypothetical protein
LLTFAQFWAVGKQSLLKYGMDKKGLSTYKYTALHGTYLD